MGQNVVVIGGGIVGMATASHLVNLGHKVVVLEKESEWAAHQTGHNSGVIHAGPYYKPGSFKAQLCTAGNASMLAFAEKYSIPHKVTGKLIVAVNDEEIPRLAVLHQRALANNVPVELIGPEHAQEIEPHVRPKQALHVKSTGIIDYVAVTKQLASLAELGGAELILGAEVVSIQTSNNKVTIEHTRGTVHADFLINCAGLYSDRIARLAGLSPAARIIPFRGEYFELIESRRNLVEGLIYPVPDPDLPFLGVHFTKMIDGSIHAGPNAVTALAREGYRWRDINIRESAIDLTYAGFLRLASKNMSVGASEVMRSMSKKLFAKSLSKIIPEVTSADLKRAGSGVRAQAITRDGSLVDDFFFQSGPRQIHVLNAPSPAATSALEIARYIAAESNLGLRASS